MLSQLYALCGVLAAGLEQWEAISVVSLSLSSVYGFNGIEIVRPTVLSHAVVSVHTSIATHTQTGWLLLLRQQWGLSLKTPEVVCTGIFLHFYFSYSIIVVIWIKRGRSSRCSA